MDSIGLDKNNNRYEEQTVDNFFLLTINKHDN